MIDADYADKIVEKILNSPLRTKSKVATAFRVKEDITVSILQIKKIHPPAHIVVISDEYDVYDELNAKLDDSRNFKGYYSNKSKGTQLKDYKVGSKSSSSNMNNYM